MTRLWRLPAVLALLAGVVALLLYLNVAFSNAGSLWHVLPTPGSLGALLDTAGQGFTEASKYAPPVPELRGMLLLAAAGVGIAALLTDLIAVRLGRAALAGLPLLLLFTEPFTLSVSRGFVGTTVAFCASVAGYLALLSSESRERIREWEHAKNPAREAPDTRPLAAAGRRVGFASVALALCLPLFIPGLHTTRLFGGGQPGIGGSPSHGGSGNVGFPDPNAQLSGELHEAQATTVLTYTTDAPVPDYLQIYTLDQLTDDGWHLFAQPRSLVPVSPALPAPPGLAAPANAAKSTTRVAIAPSVGPDDLSALPVPYPAATVIARGDVEADRSTLMVFDSDVTLGGLTYRVTSLDPAPPAGAPNAVPAPAPSIAAHYLSVPSAYDPLSALAASVTRGAKTPFQQAVALQNWLSGGAFKYTLSAPQVTDAAGLAKFLTVTRQGYCQQFSYAMAVLARLLHIPARIAWGFTSGTPSGSGTWVVTTHDAHAWPELYFQGYGWLRFEPTPSGPDGQGTAHAPGYTAAAIGPGSTGGLPTPTIAPSAQASGAQGNPSVPVRPRGVLPPGFTAPGGPVIATSQDTLSPWAIAGLVVAGLVLLAAVAPWCARRAVRRRRWGHRGAPGERGTGERSAGPPDRADRVRARDVAWAHAAWLELRDDLLDHGAGYRPSESPRAVAARAGERLSLAGPARDALGRIALAEERARYAPAPADGSRLRADSAAVRRAIAAAVPRSARWRARLLPASVLHATLNAAASLAERYRSVRGASWSSVPGLTRRRRG